MKCSTCDKDAIYGWANGGASCKECVSVQANPLPEISRLRKENAELRAKLSAQDLQVMYLEKRLDAWESQEPVAWLNTFGDPYSMKNWDDQCINPEHTPLFTRPKEA